MPKAQHANRYRLLPGLLRQMRETASLTQRELAAKLGNTHVFVHKSEVGERRVDVAEFIDWCIACGCEPEEMLRSLHRKRGT
jgi:DNA-binding XRE family transcriptional regulator